MMMRLVLGAIVNVVTERVTLCPLVAYGLEPKKVSFSARIQRGGFMLADGEAEVIQERPRARYPKFVHHRSIKKKMITYLVAATWLLSIVSGWRSGRCYSMDTPALSAEASRPSSASRPALPRSPPQRSRRPIEGGADGGDGRLAQFLAPLTARDLFGETSAKEARSRTPTRTGAEIEAGQGFVRLADALREEGGYGDLRPEVLTADPR